MSAGLTLSDPRLRENARRLVVDLPEELKLLTIIVDVFEGYFRDLSHVLAESCVMQKDAFWKLVAGRVIAYREAHTVLLEKYRQYGLFKPDMIDSCLPPLRLAKDLQRVNLADPVAPHRPQWLGRA